MLWSGFGSPRISSLAIWTSITTASMMFWLFAPCLLHRLTFNPCWFSHSLHLGPSACFMHTPTPWQRDLCNFHCCIVYNPSLLQLSALYFSVLSVICAYPSFTHYATPPFWALFVHYCFFAHSFVLTIKLSASSIHRCYFVFVYVHTPPSWVKFVHPFNTCKGRPLHHV